MKAEKIEYIEDDREYILLRPNTYVGSIVHNQIETYLLNNDKFEKQTIEYVPAFLKLVDEILSNSVDEAIKTNYKFANKIEVKVDIHGRISISDNGRGLSSEIEKNTQLPQAVVAFTKLKAGSNFRKEQASIGQNGVGASLVNIFSKEFNVVTSDGVKKTHLTCKDNLKSFNFNQRKCAQQFTQIEFMPDYEKLNMSSLDDIHIRLIEKRLININLTYPDINITFNGKKLPRMTLKTYVRYFDNELFFTESTESVDIAIIPFQQDTEYISFVNGVDTYKHGQHLIVFQRMVEKALRDSSNRKLKDITLTQFLTNCKIIIIVKNLKNPQFSAQIKDELTNPYMEVKNHFDIDIDRLINNMMRHKDFAQTVQDYSNAIKKIRDRKNLENVDKKIKKHKSAKYLPPISNKLSKCHLYICEGDSALSQLINVRDKYTAGYPLKGKIINPRTCKVEKIANNENLRDLISIMGLKLSDSSIKNFKFQSIRILTDADTDGDCITAQLLNLFYVFWPDLFKANKVFRVITPLIIAKKGKIIKNFYSLTEYYKKQDEYSIIEYNKGLGALSKDEYRKIVESPTLIQFSASDSDEQILDMVFGKSNQDERKGWLLDDDEM